jgi:hypothetical protein
MDLIIPDPSPAFAGEMFSLKTDDPFDLEDLGFRRGGGAIGSFKSPLLVNSILSAIKKQSVAVQI